MLFRGSPRHHLAWLERKIRNFPPDLRSTGLIVGDPHPGQFAEQLRGNRVVGVVLVDLDDGGQGPMIADLLRYQTAIDAARISLSSADLCKDYLAGLEGNAPTLPGRLESKIPHKAASVEKEVKNFIDKATLEKKFLNTESLDLIPKELWDEKLQSLWKESEAALAKALAPRKIIDHAARIKESGGSQGVPRFWMLTEHNGKREIFEAKTLLEPAVAQLQAQKGDETSRIENLVRSFWPPFRGQVATKPTPLKASQTGGFEVVNTENHSFWLRPRHPDSLDFEDMKKHEAKAWARYVAQKLGYMHSQNPNAPRYLAALREKGDELPSMMERFSQEYLDELERDQQKRPGILENSLR